VIRTTVVTTAVATSTTTITIIRTLNSLDHAMPEAAPVPPGSPTFDPRVVHVGFVLDQVSLWLIRLVFKYFNFPLSVSSHHCPILLLYHLLLTLYEPGSVTMVHNTPSPCFTPSCFYTLSWLCCCTDSLFLMGISFWFMPLFFQECK